MNSPKFTPGPWVTDKSLPEGVYSSDATGSIVARVGGRGFELAYRPTEERAANARLIAAAPKMYAALEAIALGNSDPDDMVRIAADALVQS